MLALRRDATQVRCPELRWPQAAALPLGQAPCPWQATPFPTALTLAPILCAWFSSHVYPTHLLPLSPCLSKQPNPPLPCHPPGQP